MVPSFGGNQMKLSKLAIWAALPLTIIGLLMSFLTAIAGAGHGDKSLIVVIFPLPFFAMVSGGWVIGLLAACLQFPLYALAIYAASKRAWEWPIAGVLLLIHSGIVIWFFLSALGR
jgi:hypothetical protein